MSQDVIQPQGQLLAPGFRGLRLSGGESQASSGLGAKSCAHQQTTAGPQTVEVEAGVTGMPGRMPGNL